MAKFTVVCPKCSAQYNVEDSHLGRKGQCSKCSTSFRLQMPASSDTRTLHAAGREARREGGSNPTIEGEATEIWNVGDVILDAYEVRLLDTGRDDAKHYAEGGMGVVYRVHHRGWD
ncbi:MAG: zinc-ribbon domain-containing protein, partial [Planctomycetes bacterium]|nr:zinc-ribbon domain-containing protein [Planctomycetota bacterium]